MVKRKNNFSKFKIKTTDLRRPAIHKSLVTQINKLQRDMQFIADKRYGKGKVKISFAYASKILAGRSK